MSIRPRLVVVGNGMTANRALELLCARLPGAFDIHVFGAEPVAAYSRVLLSSWLAGECTDDDLWLHDADWYAARGITVHAGDPVAAIDRVRRHVVHAGDATMGYDHLLLATGSLVAMPSLPGASLSGVEVFRTREDVARWLRSPVDHTVVVGGGVLGLEAAYGLSRRGAAVTLVHSASHLMERQLDGDAGEFVRARLAALGISIVLGRRCTALRGEHELQAVRLDDDREIPCARAIFATGIVPDVALARAADLPCGRGVLVDARMRTADQHISAIGECAEQDGVCHGLLAPLHGQLPAWVDGMVGESVARSAQPITQTRLKIPGIDVFVAGDLAAHAGVESVRYRDDAAGVLRELRLREGRLVGVRLCGDVSGADECMLLMQAMGELGARRFDISLGSEVTDYTTAGREVA